MICTVVKRVKKRAQKHDTNTLIIINYARIGRITDNGRFTSTKYKVRGHLTQNTYYQERKKWNINTHRNLVELLLHRIKFI